MKKKKKLVKITSRSGRNQNSVLNQRLLFNQIIRLKLNIDFKMGFLKDVLIFKILLHLVRTKGVKQWNTCTTLHYSLTYSLTSCQHPGIWSARVDQISPTQQSWDVCFLFHLSHKCKNSTKDIYNTLLTEDIQYSSPYNQPIHLKQKVTLLNCNYYREIYQCQHQEAQIFF